MNTKIHPRMSGLVTSALFVTMLLSAQFVEARQLSEFRLSRPSTQPRISRPFLQERLPPECVTRLKIDPPKADAAGLVWVFVMNFDIVDDDNPETRQPIACIRFIPSKKIVDAFKKKGTDLTKLHAGYIRPCNTKGPAGGVEYVAGKAIFKGGTIECKLYGDLSIAKLVDEFLQGQGITPTVQLRTLKYNDAKPTPYVMDRFTMAAIGTVDTGFSSGHLLESPIVAMRSQDNTHLVMLSSPLPKGPNTPPSGNQTGFFVQPAGTLFAPTSPGLRFHSRSQSVAAQPVCRTNGTKHNLSVQSGDWGMYYEKGKATLVYKNQALCTARLPQFNLWLYNSVIEIGSRGEGDNLNFRGTLDEIAIDPTGSTKPPG